MEQKKSQSSNLELDVDEQRIHQTWLDTERDQGRLFDKDYRKAYNAANKRTINAGDELWQLVRKMKQEQENAGEVELLSPDSDGAFVVISNSSDSSGTTCHSIHSYTTSILLHLLLARRTRATQQNYAALLRLYEDPTTSRKRSSTQQSGTTEDAIELSGCHLGAPKDELWCPINKRDYNAHFMRAAHIVPAPLGRELVDYIFWHRLWVAPFPSR